MFLSKSLIPSVSSRWRGAFAGKMAGEKFPAMSAPFIFMAKIAVTLIFLPHPVPEKGILSLRYRKTTPSKSNKKRIFSIITPFCRISFHRRFFVVLLALAGRRCGKSLCARQPYGSGCGVQHRRKASIWPGRKRSLMALNPSIFSESSVTSLLQYRKAIADLYCNVKEPSLWPYRRHAARNGLRGQTCGFCGNGIQFLPLRCTVEIPGIVIRTGKRKGELHKLFPSLFMKLTVIYGALAHHIQSPGAVPSPCFSFSYSHTVLTEILSSKLLYIFSISLCFETAECHIYSAFMLFNAIIYRTHGYLSSRPGGITVNTGTDAWKGDCCQNRFLQARLHCASVT